jgi:transcription termination factor Rho
MAYLAGERLAQIACHARFSDLAEGLSTDAAPIAVSGVLELQPVGYGVVRDPAKGYRPSASDAVVPAALVQQFELRQGAAVGGLAHRLAGRENLLVHELTDVEGCPPAEYRHTPRFAALTPIHPQSLLRLETGPQTLSTRIVDLFVPVGKGQRGLIVAPPRTGKTVLLKEIGQAISINYPEAKLVVLLVDERPEEVTDISRQIAGQVMASSLDRDLADHVRLSQLVVERCKRMAERGQDVVLLIDSLTRMARAFNKSVRKSGKTLTGGLNAAALDIPKKLFASARAFEEGGSLTILATVLIDTGSRMDDLIFEEFKGTGNLELVLDRRLAERRVWPAINLAKSGTRRDEKLLDARTLQAVRHRRRNWNVRQPAEAVKELVAQLTRHRSNREWVETVLRHAVIADES